MESVYFFRTVEKGDQIRRMELNNTDTNNTSNFITELTRIVKDAPTRLLESAFCYAKPNAVDIYNFTIEYDELIDKIRFLSKNILSKYAEELNIDRIENGDLWIDIVYLEKYPANYKGFRLSVVPQPKAVGFFSLKNVAKMTVSVYSNLRFN